MQVTTIPGVTLLCMAAGIFTGTLSRVYLSDIQQRSCPWRLHRVSLDYSHLRFSGLEVKLTVRLFQSKHMGLGSLGIVYTCVCLRVVQKL